MHGVREELLDMQADSIGIPLQKIKIPEFPDLKTYENTMSTVLLDYKAKGATASVFGDIFLEDLRRYRENKLSEMKLKAIFPLWNSPTDKLIREFIGLGFKTIVTCVNEKHLDKSFAGRIIDNDFLNDLPDNVDPCGENGEFHTFVFDGPLFKNKINFAKGDIVYKTYSSNAQSNNTNKSVNDDIVDDSLNSGFWFCDLKCV